MAKKCLIRDAQTLRRYMQKIRNPVFGIGTRPYNFTIGAYKLFRHFEILACKRIGTEIPLIEKEIKITYLDHPDDEVRTAKNNNIYTKKTPLNLLRSKKNIRYLNSFKEKPILLFNQMPKEMEQLLKKKDYVVVSSGFRMFHKYENKINFQNLLDQLGIPSPKHTIFRGKTLEYGKISKLVGKKFVIQLPDAALGAGTFFIFKKNDLIKLTRNSALRDAINSNIKLKITQFIEQVFSPSITVCVTKFGVLYTGIQKQIVGANEVIGDKRISGVFCGHDWTSSNFNPGVKKQAVQIAKKIGAYFKKKEKFHGIFGIDFVLEKNTNRLFPVEANVRLLGSFPVLSMIQEAAKQPLIQGLQILENLNRDDYRLDIKSINKLMSKPKNGSHLNIYARGATPSIISGNIKPGIYRTDKKYKRINFSREGVFFEDLKNNNEILLTGGVPIKGQVFEPHQNICKLISRGAFLDSSGKLNSFSKLMVRYVYRKLGMRKLKSS